jgi:hypothetical protein
MHFEEKKKVVKFVQNCSNFENLKVDYVKTGFDQHGTDQKLALITG